MFIIAALICLFAYFFGWDDERIIFKKRTDTSSLGFQSASIVSVLNQCWIQQEIFQRFYVSWGLSMPQHRHHKFKLFPKNNKLKCKTQLK
jgi:hypothetical protein